MFKNDMNTFWTAMGAIFSFFMSLIAIIFTYWQILLSNRHSLFDKRMINFQEIQEYLTAMARSNNRLQGWYDNKEEINVSLSKDLLGILHYIPSLYEINDKGVKFDIKVYKNVEESIRKSSLMCKFLYSRKNSKFAMEFLDNYADLVKSLCLYIGYEEIITSTDKHVSNNPLLHHRIESIEEASRCLEKLTTSYNEMIEKNVLSNLEREIRITNVFKK